MSKRLDDLSVYIPMDRRHAIARGEAMPDRTRGAALFADISGFTPLTEALTLAYGPRRSAEELTQHINAAYEALIAEIDRYGGSVISFAGDSVTCWFDEASTNPSASARAVACALAMQTAVQKFPALTLPDRTSTNLAMKATVASGPARRFVVGDPEIQWLDALAGNTLARMAAAERLANPGEVLIDVATLDLLGSQVQISEWREEPDSHERFAVARSSEIDVTPSPWDDLVQPLSIEQARPWLLKTVYARHLAGQGEFLTELRPAVALFMRFGGIAYDEDDDAGAKLDAFICRVQQVLQRFEGTPLDLNIGDKGSYMSAAFGAPQSHEDDAERAVHAALALLQVPTELSFIRPLQIGISQGTMRVGAYGSTTRRTYGVMGNEVNLAARLMVQAAPGELLISARIQKAVAGQFDLEPLPPIKLKGKSEPLLPFLVKGSSLEREVRQLEPHFALPMIGREKELARIDEKLTLTLQGKGQLVGITAEAGMGKSRLVAEVIRLAKRRGFRGYIGACQSYGTNTMYSVWGPIWREFFAVDETAPMRRQLRNLEGEIIDLAPDRVQATPLLAPLLQIPIPENDFTQSLEPQHRKSALEALLLDCVRAAAQQATTDRKALLFVLEDLHWIDPVSHDLLEALAQTIPGLPILIVLAYRPHDAAHTMRQSTRFEALPHFTRIALTELTAAEVEALIRAKLAQFAPERAEAIPRGLFDQITAKAEGNPFYVEELLNYLRDRGLDPFDVSSLATLELPNSLHRLILSRIDQLTEPQQLTLKVASIIGRLFRVAHLRDYYPALGTPDELKANLDELDRLDLTPLDTPEPEMAYLFKHIVTHEVAYESLVYATRAALHEQYASYLETLIASGAMHESSSLGLLAHHYSHSENLVKKRKYLWRAGEAAQAAYANSTALDYYDRLLLLLTDPRERSAIQLKAGAVLELIGRWSEAEARYEEALALAERASDRSARAQCRQALGVLSRQRGDHDAALKWLELAEKDWIFLEDQHGFIRVLTEKGIVFRRKGEYETARQNLETSLDLARGRGDLAGMAMALQQQGVVANLGDYAGTQALYEESLALWRTLGNKEGIASVLNDMGILVSERGEFEAARALYDESLALQRELGDKRGIALALNNLGSLVEEQSNYAAALAFYEESLAFRREMGDKPGIATLLCNLGIVAVEQGNYAKAGALYDESMKLRRETGDKRAIGYCALCQGLLARAEGHLNQAHVLFSEALAQFRETGSKRNIANCLAALTLAAMDPLTATKSLALAERAAQLSGSTDALLRSLKTHLERQFRLPYEHAVAELQAILGNDAFAAARKAGEQMTLEDAIALASAPGIDQA